MRLLASPMTETNDDARAEAEEMRRYHGLTRAEHEALMVQNADGSYYCPSCEKSKPVGTEYWSGGR